MINIHKVIKFFVRLAFLFSLFIPDLIGTFSYNEDILEGKNEAISVRYSQVNELQGQELNCLFHPLLILEGMVNFFKKSFFTPIEKTNDINILDIPDELILIMAKSLTTKDVINLSYSCKRYYFLFDDFYWTSVFSGKSYCSSYLIHKYINISSFVLNRREFFSHLFYCEGDIESAAILGHPEAVALKEYGPYGFYIEKNQCLFPCGTIRFQSGEIASASMETLRKAQRKKILKTTQLERDKHDRQYNRSFYRRYN